jgi:N-acetylmuramoyl-L-alanine amidase
MPALKKMKSSLFSLTILFAFLPSYLFHFNTSEKVTTQGAFFYKNVEKSDLTQLLSDAILGKDIKELQTCIDYRIQKIVIDAGHGGRDGGCSGHLSREKHVSLNIALMVGKTIEVNYPGIQVIYTRTKDVFVPLNKRAEIANKSNADLFISVHCNFIPNASHVDGSETYVLGLHRAKDNLAVAKRENAAIFYEENYKANYDGYDPNSPEGHIILSMFQNAYLEQSISLANKIENNIKHDAGRKSRGVKQAGFLVLRKTTMPSVLVESGYLSNKSDDQYLSKDYGQKQIAKAIFNAFAEYKNEVEGNLAGFTKRDQVVAVAPKYYPVATTAKVYEPKMIKSPSRRAVPQKEQVSAKGLKPSLIIPSKKETSKTVSVPLVKKEKIESKIKFKVLLEVTDRFADTQQTKWKTLNYSIQVLKENNTFKYLAIGFQSYEEAAKAKNRLRKSGFNEAFVVAYQNGKRIKMEDALKQGTH